MSRRDKKSIDLFNGMPDDKKGIWTYRDRSTVDLFTNDTDQEAGRPVPEFTRSTASVAEDLKIGIFADKTNNPKQGGQNDKSGKSRQSK